MTDLPKDRAVAVGSGANPKLYVPRAENPALTSDQAIRHIEHIEANLHKYNDQNDPDKSIRNDLIARRNTLRAQAFPTAPGQTQPTQAATPPPEPMRSSRISAAPYRNNPCLTLSPLMSRRMPRRP